MTEQSIGLLGSTATIPTGSRYLHNQRLGLLEVTDPSRLDIRFCYHLMNASAIREQIQATATGSKVRHTAPERIRALQARLPDVASQRLAADVLDAIDDLIENNRRRIEVLEQMAQAIYREWFVRFRYPGHEDATFVDSPLGSVPHGWDVLPFSDIASFVNGFAFKPSHWGDAGRPIIKIKELKEGVTRDTPRCSEREIARKYWIEPGDLLFSWSADLGAYRWSDEPGLLNQHLFIVRPTAHVSLAFLLHSLDGSMGQFWDRAQGTTMRHIKRSALTEVQAVVPDGAVVDRFTQSVEPMDQSALALRRTNRQLAALRDLLLPKLVTGQIDVSNLDLDALVVATA